MKLCFKKSGKKKNLSNHNTRSWALRSYKRPIRCFSPRQQHRTTSKTLTYSLASSDAYSTHNQIVDLGIKEALAHSCVRARLSFSSHRGKRRPDQLGHGAFRLYASDASKLCGERDSKLGLIQTKRLTLKSWQELLR